MAALRHRRGRSCWSAAVLAVNAAPAWASDAALQLRFDAASFCEFASHPTISPPVNMSVTSTSANATVLTITEPIDGSGRLNAASFLFTVQATCNLSSRVVLQTHSGGLARATLPPAGGRDTGPLRRRIDYTATAVWPVRSVADISTDGTPGATSTGGTVTGPRSGNLRLSFNLDNTPTEMVAAGDHRDTLTLRIEPQ